MQFNAHLLNKRCIFFKKNRTDLNSLKNKQINKYTYIFFCIKKAINSINNENLIEGQRPYLAQWFLSFILLWVIRLIRFMAMRLTV